MHRRFVRCAPGCPIKSEIHHSSSSNMTTEVINMSKPKGKTVRPSTASGIIQSYEVSHILDDIRPNTALGVNVKEVLPGLEPTYVTSQRPPGTTGAGGSTTVNKMKGRQVHGGVDKNDLKHNRARRATIGPSENISAYLGSSQRARRPITAGAKAGTMKV